MTVSIKDIAREAGVSHSTVSRALSGSALVNAETAERIRDLAREMGYTPSAIGRSLVTRRTRTLGLVVSRLTNPHIAQVAHAVEVTAMDHGYSVLLCSAGSPDREVAAVQMLRERRVDGIVVQSSVIGDRYMSLLNDVQAPIVLINNQRDGQYVYSVDCDNRQGGREAVAYLVAKGHTRVGYVAGPAEALANRQRRQGWRDALAEAGLPHGDDLVAGAPEDLAPTAAGEAAVLDLLARPRPPTALFCYNDMTALGALRAARRLGRRVPADLSVVGFDDILMAAYTDPPLTTVAQPKEALGRRAVEMLLALLSGAEPPQRAVLIPARLVERESVAARTAQPRLDSTP